MKKKLKAEWLTSSRSEICTNCSSEIKSGALFYKESFDGSSGDFFCKNCIDPLKKRTMAQIRDLHSTKERAIYFQLIKILSDEKSKPIEI